MQRLDTRELWAPKRMDSWLQEAVFLCFLCVFAFLSRANPLLDQQRLLWITVILLASNAAIHRFHRNLPGIASLVSMGLNSLLLSYLVDSSGGRDSILWPMFLLPIYTAGLTLPDWTLRVAGLQTAILLCFYAEPLSGGDGLAMIEVLFKVGFLIFSAWIVGLLGHREHVAQSRLALSEQKLERLNTQLEHRIRERTFQIQAAMKELEAFSFSASHDLIAPLRKISGFASVLISRVQGRFDAESLDILRRIERNTIRMTKLVEDLLAFSRLDQVALKSADVDMAALAHEVLEELQTAELKDLHVKVGDLPPAWGNRALLRQVLINLFSNAFKFTGRTPRPRIEIGARLGGEENVYYVKDNGAGFDQAQTARLFQAFQRLHNPMDFQGSGIGLAMIKRIITRLGGRVWAEGQVGKGASFYFTLRPAGQKPE